jgi:hypothetical protein
MEREEQFVVRRPARLLERPKGGEPLRREISALWRQLKRTLDDVFERPFP